VFSLGEQVKLPVASITAAQP